MAELQFQFSKIQS